MIRTYPIPMASSITVACCSLIAIASQVRTNLRTMRGEENRQHALTTIVQHVSANSCWQLEAQNLLKIGNPINIGSGKSPTSCFINQHEDNLQYVFVAYLNNQLQVRYIFSPTEIENHTSTMELSNNDGF